MKTTFEFPRGFLWGAATSAYQVEGGIENCDWATPHQKIGGGPAGIACDHYNRYQEDFDLLKQLNQNSYRFSVEWSRIEPREGFFDEKEIEHYRQVLLALRLREIKTMMTLHHFTTPLWMAKKGGWANPKIVFYFSRFCQRIFNEYKDLIDFWIPINEPMNYSSIGYLEARWVPWKRNPILFLKVVKNQADAHKKVYEIFHKSKQDVKVGNAESYCFFEPANPKLFLDRLNANLYRYFGNRWFLNRVKKHLDFIGLNYYFHRKIKFPFLIRNDNKIVSDIGWEIYPEGIYWVLRELKKYNLPIYITENGLADGKDILRKDFIKEHLFWTYKAIQESADVRGYFHWSLMDNFEWEKGFEPRFGLIEIDYKTLERKPRPSAFYYAEICKSNQLIINPENASLPLGDGAGN